MGNAIMRQEIPLYYDLCYKVREKYRNADLPAEKDAIILSMITMLKKDGLLDEEIMQLVEIELLIASPWNENSMANDKNFKRAVTKALRVSSDP